MSNANCKLAHDLLSANAVRERCQELFSIAEANELKYFKLNLQNLDAASEAKA